MKALSITLALAMTMMAAKSFATCNRPRAGNKSMFDASLVRSNFRKSEIADLNATYKYTESGLVEKKQ